MRVFSWFISIILVVVVTGLVFVHLSPDYSMYLVRSESMKPAINTGDIIVVSSVNGPLNVEVRPGMIITYERGKELVTHRVVSVDGDTLVTKGDAAEDPDPRPVAMSEVSGVYIFKIPYLGYVSSFVGTKLGWFIIIIIPAMLLVALLIRDIVKKMRSGAQITGLSKRGGGA